ncbi:MULTISPECIES: hypothetical protein [unclassified Micromonospora]|uniref:hypothetical protein n=1 Tax=unclassified Micromonospora TaxID=2617518 RepID=UPI001B396700|nr:MULTISPECIES: hypothetical protein [unclassified Micromonospora]MBQ1042585.1 hypothetical protein [Micromonospora sp. C72]MBQ1058283.1 hypothetical protein [Micromonospora sp. C32]
MQVIHQPRVAWDAARVIGAAVHDEELFRWLYRVLGDLLGPATWAALDETRDRVRRAGDARLSIETGVWRARLEDSLRGRPDLAGELAGVVATVRAVRPI